jgi:hypothetical protein
MAATLEGIRIDAATRKALLQFFEHSSAYVIGEETKPPEHIELAERWSEQCVLDNATAAITEGRDAEAMSLAVRFVPRPAVYAALLARMMQTGRASLIRFVVDAVERDASLGAQCFGGRALLHYASGTGCLSVVRTLLRLGTDPDIRDHGGHTPLYHVANECALPEGPEIVRALVEAGADVNDRGGVTRATALHMAARRGYMDTARALIDCGAAVDARDRSGCTPLQRAVNCRKHQVAQLLADYAASDAQ